MLKQEHKALELKTKKIKAKAHSNIAFIKYWGKKDEKLRIPANSSISMNLSDAYTITSIQLKESLKSDKVYINEQEITDAELNKISKYLDLFRERSKNKTFSHK
jgi:Mevalonate pyrophosphate decarboxylase